MSGMDETEHYYFDFVLSTSYMKLPILDCFTFLISQKGKST